jgi:uncharacterized membrane protein
MASTWIFRLAELHRRLWVRAVTYAVASIGAVLLAAVAAPTLGLEGIRWLEGEVVDDLLSVLASTMLAVATFSLSIMVAAYAGASSNATPRVTALLLEDTTSQRALCAFVGAFIYGIVGLVALGSGIYDEAGRSGLFIVTLVVIGIVVATLLRWIDHLSRFGFMRDTLNRVETATWEALAERIRNPYLGGHRSESPPANALPLHAMIPGYLLNVDMPRLDELARTHGLSIHLAALPGCFVGPGRALALVVGDLRNDVRQSLVECFVTGDARNFRQDPRFGFVVLAEIASRALSPAVNDPGTAIQVVNAGTRLLTRWAGLRAETALPPVAHPRVWVPPIRVADVFEDLFRPVARDGAGLVEVGLRLQKAFAHIAAVPDEDFQRPARAAAADDAQLLAACHRGNFP